MSGSEWSHHSAGTFWDSDSNRAHGARKGEAMPRMNENDTELDRLVARLERLAARMQAVYGGATLRRESDNAYDWAKEIRAALADAGLGGGA